MKMKTRVRTFIPPRYSPAARNLYRGLRALPYIGNRVYCPCCDGHFRRFLPYGFKAIRQNALCPRCGAGERHRLMWLYFQNRTNLFRDKLKVLHFAPEAIIEQKLRTYPNLDYTSADLNPRSAMVTMDITDIPYEEHTIDVILCSHVLEHIPDDRMAMSELYRVLKPGGWAILLVPLDPMRANTFEDPSTVDPQERYHLFGQIDHVRVYGRDYTTRLEYAGFTVHQEPYARELGPDLIQRYGLEANDDIFCCTKSI